MNKLFLVALLIGADAAVVKETLVIEEWVVDYLRPTADLQGGWPWQTDATIKTPFEVNDALRATKYMINGSYPAPTIWAAENDTMEITIVNNMFSEATTIHWHGRYTHNVYNIYVAPTNPRAHTHAHTPKPNQASTCLARHTWTVHGK